MLHLIKNIIFFLFLYNYSFLFAAHSMEMDERGEAAYLAEYNRVASLIESNKQTLSLNLDNKGIFWFPDDAEIMGKMAHCTYVDLSYNHLEALPNAISTWESLTSLDLRYNNITIAPWQVFTVGQNNKSTSAFTIIIILSSNPIKQIPDDFFKAIMAQKGKCGNLRGFSVEFDESVIETCLLPRLKKWPALKKYLVKSSQGKINNGFCTIQNPKGEFLSFDSKKKPLFSYGTSLFH